MNPTQRSIFYREVRATLFKRGLIQAQVDTIEAILNYWYQNHARQPVSFLAYILATAYWETFPDMQPNRERGGDKYLFDMYDPDGKRPNLARQNGNRTRGDGVRYAGKGLVHATWRNNYARVDKRFGFNTVENPDQMLQLSVAVPVLVDGMLEGMFTGVSLSEVIQDETQTLEQFLDDRAVVNGKDRARDIAKVAVKFQTAISTALSEQPLIQNAPEELHDYATGFRAPLEAHYQAETPQAPAQGQTDAKPLISSLVVRSVAGGLFGYVAVKYGIDVPDEYRELLVNTILGASASGAIWGRVRATQAISGILPKLSQRTFGGR